MMIGLLFAINIYGQEGYLKGKIVDAATGEPLVGATVFNKETSGGTTAGLDGTFRLQTSKGEQKILFRYVGYISKEKQVNVTGTKEMGTIEMKANAVGLKEVKIISDQALDRKTPIAVSTIPSAEIETRLGTQEFPEIMNSTPGIYATKSGGGFGDSRINVRGFDQRNVAVLINGVPVNDMENGWVYWSNWAGLADATRTIQVQRGLGASKLAISSVGGTINIITKTTDAQKGGFAESSMTSYGNSKFKVGLSTGLMDNGFAVSFVGSRTKGPGYVDQTWVDAWSYFLSISKDLNENHQLVLTAIGAPQKHGQRDGGKYDAYTQEEIDQYGVTYNHEWGYLDGRVVNEDVNYYHKPQIALNHYWDISDKSFLATSYYISTGNGGGSGPLGPLSYTSRKTNSVGQYDYDWLVEQNTPLESPYFFNNNGVPVPFPDGNGLIYNDTTKYDGSKYILRNSVNNHFWTGLLSSFYHDFSENLKLTAGIDLRYYRGEHYREVKDLLGGNYFNDGVYRPESKVGDKIDYHNDGIVSYGGLFGQLEYSTDKLSAFIAGSGSNTYYNRIDYMSYLDEGDDNAVSGVESQPGYNIKAGANYNINNNHNIFVNGGYYARAPYFDYVFINYLNDVNEDYTTEKITGLEAGYGYTGRNLKIRLNYYYTHWADRWVDTYFPGAGRTIYFKGLEQLHTGMEAEVSTKIFPSLRIDGYASIGNWVYQNNVEVNVYDEQTLDLIGTFQAYTKDLKVADAPQTQFGLNADWQITNKINFGATWNYNDQLFADFDPLDRTNPDDTEQSFQIPSYSIVHARAGYSFKLSNDLDAHAGIVVNNLLNEEYIMEGYDLGNHDMESFVGMWGWKRTFNFSLRVNF